MTSCGDALKPEHLFRIKPVEMVLAEVATESGGEGASLRRVLSACDLTMLGLGCCVGAGIYSLVGVGAAIAGPAIALSFVVGGVACIFTGLSYSEFAARLPVAGSAYSYTYTSFGEFAAMMMGWTLTLEYAISSAAIARSWASYMKSFFDEFDVDAPRWLYDIDLGNGDSASLLAVVIIGVCTAVMMLGIKSSSRANNLFTSLNLAVLAFVICAGIPHVDPHNWTTYRHSFVPYGAGSIFQGAGTTFFSYIGFDLLTTQGLESRNPQKTLPIGIMGSLLISASIYVAVALVVTGMVPFTDFTATDDEEAAPLPIVFKLHHESWAAKIIVFGSVFGLTSATFTCLLGQPRIFYAMAKDGLLPSFFSDVSPKVGVPVKGCLLTGAVTAAIAFVTELHVLADAISIGTLFAFSVVSMGVLLFRYHPPDIKPGDSEYNPSRWPSLCLGAFFLLSLGTAFAFQLKVYWATGCLAALLAADFVALLRFPRPPSGVPPTFACPAVPWFPCAGILVNSFMLAGLKMDSWIRLFGWMFLGLLVYFGYSVSHSVLRRRAAAGERLEDDRASSLSAPLLDLEVTRAEHRRTASGGSGASGGGRGRKIE